MRERRQLETCDAVNGADPRTGWPSACGSWLSGLKTSRRLQVRSHRDPDSRGRSGDPQRNSPQPVFDPKIVDPREFTFVVGHYSVA